MRIFPDRRIWFHSSATIKRKVTEVALLRTSSRLEMVSDIPARHGSYEGMTNNINWGRPGCYLYLVWKCVLVD